MTLETSPFAATHESRASIWRCRGQAESATASAAQAALEHVLHRRALKRDGRTSTTDVRPSAAEVLGAKVVSAVDDLRAQAQVPRWLFVTALLGAITSVIGIAFGSWLLQPGPPCPVHPVAGRVALGKAVPAGAEIVFHPVAGELPEQAVPRATVRDDGSFTVSTFQSDDGAPEGKYVVTIQWFRLSNDGAPGPNVLPRRYAAPESTPLQVAIAPGSNQLAPFTICR